MTYSNDLMTKTWAHNLATSQEADWLRTWKKARPKGEAGVEFETGFAAWAAVMIRHVHAHGQEFDKDRVY